jgi:hypothetical protein
VRFDLLCHPETPASEVTGVTVEVLAGQDDVLLTYCVHDYGKVSVPSWRSPARVNGLWRTTCFEMFLKPAGEDDYFEFNFSPSSEWAAYAFTGYRDGMRDLDRDVAPHIERLADGVEVDCDLGGLRGGVLHLALSAVIEESDGTKSYWALAHPPGPPDFHHPACFAATLPAPAAA